jgi:hypothetical protein
LHIFRKDIELPFRMWLYPLPAVLAMLGWAYIAIAPEQRQNVGTALGLVLLGAGAYLIRARVLSTWPLAKPVSSTTGRSA